jgi:hypothetical protein
MKELRVNEWNEGSGTKWKKKPKKFGYIGPTIKGVLGNLI